MIAFPLLIFAPNFYANGCKHTAAQNIVLPGIRSNLNKHALGDGGTFHEKGLLADVFSFLRRHFSNKEQKLASLHIVFLGEWNIC